MAALTCVTTWRDQTGFLRSISVTVPLNLMTTQQMHPCDGLSQVNPQLVSLIVQHETPIARWSPALRTSTISSWVV